MFLGFSLKTGGGEPNWPVTAYLSGGVLTALLTAVRGASEVTPGGIVAYSDEAKRDLLDVPAEVLEREGAVSEAAARAMADGVRRRLGTDGPALKSAVSTTGSAGSASTSTVSSRGAGARATASTSTGRSSSPRAPATAGRSQ